jgi:Ran GTPase-activating protein (RanGAP) involved in mRNA processing and transport
VSEAIKQGACPEDRVLSLGGDGIDQELGRVLGEALQARALPKLDTLMLKQTKLGDEGVVAIMGALGGGSCPGLKTLCLPFNGSGPVSGVAVAFALRSGHLSHLGFLSLAFNEPVGDHAVAQVIEALSGGRCPNPRSLGMRETGMGEEAGQALLQALRDKAWPQLARLDVASNGLLGDATVGVGLAEVLERGACPRLEELAIEECGLSKEGGERLRQALMSGACPKLKKLCVDEDLDVDWEEAMASCDDEVMIIRF